MAYQVHLSQFNGPLDLLLHLIEQAEVDIKDIFVSEITAQYLAYMEEIDQLDLDTASEFLTMAATLLYIKSRQLLPRPPKEGEEEEDPEVLLIRQLKEYKLFKQAGEELRGLQERARGAFTRLPEEFLLPPQEITLDGAVLSELSAAFFALLQAEAEREGAEENPLHQVRQDAFTVRRKLSEIRALLKDGQERPFEALFMGQATKIEKIVTFMALLEMISRAEIELHQKEPFAPIRLKALHLLEDDEMLDYMDEYAN